MTFCSGRRGCLTIRKPQKTALDLGLLLGRSALAGRDKLTLTFSPQLEPLGPWIEQLVGESTGKDGKGIVPVIGEKELPAELYPDDRIYSWTP